MKLDNLNNLTTLEMVPHLGVKEVPVGQNNLVVTAIDTLKINSRTHIMKKDNSLDIKIMKRIENTNHNLMMINNHLEEAHVDNAVLPELKLMKGFKDLILVEMIMNLMMKYPEEECV